MFNRKFKNEVKALRKLLYATSARSAHIEDKLEKEAAARSACNRQIKDLVAVVEKTIGEAVLSIDAHHLALGTLERRIQALESWCDRLETKTGPVGLPPMPVRPPMPVMSGDQAPLVEKHIRMRMEAQKEAMGANAEPGSCPECNGSGTVNGQTCRCGGTGLGPNDQTKGDYGTTKERPEDKEGGAGDIDCSGDRASASDSASPMGSPQRGADIG